MEYSIKTSNLLSMIAKVGLLVIGLMVFGFALIMGAEDYGGGFNGILKNSPNALPWLLLLAAVYVAWKWELVGGILVTVLGIGLVWFFNFSGPNFWWITFAVTMLIPLLGVMILVGWYMGKNKKEG